MKFHLFFFFGLLPGWMTPVFAGSLKDPILSHVVNDVRILDQAKASRPAVPPIEIRNGARILTGVQSRAELHFPDHTLIRLGAETALRFKTGSRDLLLERGTLLLQVPKFHGGARVLTGSLAAVCGGATILLEHLPSQSLKVVVLEGDLRVATGGFLGDSLVIPPGKMLITAPDVKNIPDPVDVDLGTLVKTSALLDARAFSAAPLARLPLIQREIMRQTGSLKVRRLIPTNLAIFGSGTNIVIPTAPLNGSTDEGVPGTSGRSETGVPTPAEIGLGRKPTVLPGKGNSPPQP